MNITLKTAIIAMLLFLVPCVGDSKKNKPPKGNGWYLSQPEEDARIQADDMQVQAAMLFVKYSKELAYAYKEFPWLKDQYLDPASSLIDQLEIIPIEDDLYRQKFDELHSLMRQIKILEQCSTT